jgi:phage terminase large subunit-like protein
VPPDNELDMFTKFCLAIRLEQGGPMVLEPFQQRILDDFFEGARETLVLLPKKNGKTTLLAALAIYHLLTTPDAECVIAAASREQAMILFDAASGFIRRTPGLARRAKTQGGYRQIRNLADSGRVRVLAADVDTADGVRPTLALVDELHRHRSAGLYGVFRDGLGPRDGRMITISTAGDNESSPLGEMCAAARQLPVVQRDGAHLYARSNDGGYAMHEWSLTKDDDLQDMAVVKRANPASWQTLEALAARHDSPSMLPWQWARFACGIWTASEMWWVSGEQWAAANTGEQLLPGDRVTLGFDGARSGDATALIACRIDDALIVPLAVWEPPDGPAANDWTVPAGAVDKAVHDAMRTYQVVRGYFDPPLWQSEIEGWEREYGSAVRGWATNRPAPMSAAVERFRTDLVAGRLRHNGDPVLARHVLNARTRETRSGYWLTKERQANKIDAAVAAVLAYEARCDALEAQPVKSRQAVFV